MILLFALAGFVLLVLGFIIVGSLLALAAPTAEQRRAAESTRGLQPGRRFQ